MIYVVSYPKCGRTWIRTLISKYAEFAELEFVDDDTQESTDIVFTHIGFGAKPELKKKKIHNDWNKEKHTRILLSRDIPDTLVSLYWDYKVRLPERIKRRGIDDFCLEQLEHVLNFYDKTDESDWNLKITYEEMIHNPKRIISILKLVFGKVIDYDALHKAIDYCQFDNLREKEESGEIDLRWRASFHKKGHFKTRKGKVGSAKEELKPETLKKLYESIRHHNE